MKDIMTQLFSANGKISSKRVLTVAAFALLAIAYISNLYWGFKVDEGLSKSLETIVEAGMVTIVAEKFGKQSSTEQP